jgi:hypothetical protein
MTFTGKDYAPAGELLNAFGPEMPDQEPGFELKKGRKHPAPFTGLHLAHDVTAAGSLATYVGKILKSVQPGPSGCSGTPRSISSIRRQRGRSASPARQTSRNE